MPFQFVRNDITKMHTDAIVNAANSHLAAGGGVCGAIFSAAGHRELEQACNKIGRCSVGGAAITKGFALPAKYIIHAVGPIWQGGRQNEARLLHDAYTNSLCLAAEHNCKSVAFPLISSGIYGYPKAEALQIAIHAISEFLLSNEMDVYLVLFDRSSVTLSEKLSAGIQSYIDDHYVEEHAMFSRRINETAIHEEQLAEQELMIGNALPPDICAAPCAASEPKKRALEDLMFQLDESFSKRLLRLIDEKGMTDAEVYKRANIDRKLFSKIRKDSYNPSKQTAIALAIALRLNLDETKDLLCTAGYTLSHSNKFDVIIEYCIKEQIYDIYEINEALFCYDQKLLGA